MSNKCPIAGVISKTYADKMTHFLSTDIFEATQMECLQHIDCGLRLGSFLAEAGWLTDSVITLTTVLRLINQLTQDYNTLLIKLDCLQRYVTQLLTIS